MRKLVVVPGGGGIGGTTVTLSLTIQGFEQCGAAERLSVLVRAGSELERYLHHAGQASYLHPIPAASHHQFGMRALQWVIQQPQNWPLFLDGWTASAAFPALALATPALRLSGRPIYHFFHDPAHSRHPLANLARKLIFSGLSPVALCNSHFSAAHVSPRLLPKIQDILYQPVDLEKFATRSVIAPPESLKPILDSGAKIMLTPSRIGTSEQFNDKNLRGLIPVLAQLKSWGYFYHGIVIGRDSSGDRSHAQALLAQAQRLGVDDRFTVLAPTFSIQDYYNYADVVVTLAPREPFGRTVVEAIACGVPVIGSRTGGIGEILNHFAPQWTVEPDDPMAAAQAIISMANDPQTSQLLAQGRAWVEEQCSPTHYARRLMEIAQLDHLSQPENEYSPVTI